MITEIIESNILILEREICLKELIGMPKVTQPDLSAKSPCLLLHCTLLIKGVHRQEMRVDENIEAALTLSRGKL